MTATANREKDGRARSRTGTTTHAARYGSPTPARTSLLRDRRSPSITDPGPWRSSGAGTLATGCIHTGGRSCVDLPRQWVRDDRQGRARLHRGALPAAIHTVRPVGRDSPESSSRSALGSLPALTARLPAPGEPRCGLSCEPSLTPVKRQSTIRDCGDGHHWHLTGDIALSDRSLTSGGASRGRQGPSRRWCFRDIFCGGCEDKVRRGRRLGGSWAAQRTRGVVQGCRAVGELVAGWSAPVRSRLGNAVEHAAQSPGHQQGGASEDAGRGAFSSSRTPGAVRDQILREASAAANLAKGSLRCDAAAPPARRPPPRFRRSVTRRHRGIAGPEEPAEAGFDERPHEALDGLSAEQ